LRDVRTLGGERSHSWSAAVSTSGRASRLSPPRSPQAQRGARSSGEISADGRG
jgi:hypothetical protein